MDGHAHASTHASSTRVRIHAYLHACIYIYAPLHLFNCVPMQPCIYASMHLCICAPVHLCIYASMHLCAHACTHVCMRVWLACLSSCICECLSLRLFVYLHVCLFVPLCLSHFVGMIVCCLPVNWSIHLSAVSLFICVFGSLRILVYICPSKACCMPVCMYVHVCGCGVRSYQAILHDTMRHTRHDTPRYATPRDETRRDETIRC